MNLTRVTRQKTVPVQSEEISDVNFELSHERVNIVRRNYDSLSVKRLFSSGSSDREEKFVIVLNISEGEHEFLVPIFNDIFHFALPQHSGNEFYYVLLLLAPVENPEILGRVKCIISSRLMFT